MKTVYNALASSAFILAFASIPIALGEEIQTSFDGSIELEQRLFFNRSGSSDLAADRGQSSLKLSAELYSEWDDGNSRLVLEPFARLDSDDDRRTHSDLRQLLFTRYLGDFEFSAGLGQVFWGVTETQHLVDIINQTDLVENIDGEDKLGQPMIKLGYFGDLGAFEAYVMPYFRKRTLPGPMSRLNGGLNISRKAIFEDDDEEQHLDFALRYSFTVGDLSVGLSAFDGTSREPDLLRNLNPFNLSTTPYYPQIAQLGLDVQVTTGGWLFKLEAIDRSFDDSFYEDYQAATIGSEYTIVGVKGSIYDLGLLAEYSWDGRDLNSPSIFQNDAFIGARLALNDLYDSSILLGWSKDLDNSDSESIFIEAATRISPSATLNLELRSFDSDTPSDPLYAFRQQSFIQIGLEYYFN